MKIYINTEIIHSIMPGSQWFGEFVFMINIVFMWFQVDTNNLIFFCIQYE